jgi:nitrate reductase NapAB chaperone NapD
MAIYDVCGVLVHTKAGTAAQVAQRLAQFVGVEVHAIATDNRLVVTVEQTPKAGIADVIGQFHDVKNVLSAAVIYQHSEDIEPFIL